MSTAGNGGAGWKEHWFNWPEQSADIIGMALEQAEKYNVYFSAHLFSERSSRKELVLPTRTIQADLDGADIFNLPITPTVLVKTSEDRHQAYWVLKQDPSIITPTDQLESFSRRLTYSITDCDRTGWPLGHRLRFPNTFNYKYEQPQAVEIITIAHRRIDVSTLEVLPEVDYKGAPIEDWVNTPHSPLKDVPPQETIVALQRAGKISAVVKTQYSNLSKDRSAALWRLMCELFLANCGRDLVYWLAYNSRNNKFLDRKYGGVRDLRKDIIRAEAYTSTTGVNIKEAIDKIRKQSGASPGERDEMISKAVLTYMQSKGSFVRGKDGVNYYIKSETGRPFVIDINSERVAAFMTAELGINSASGLYRHVMHSARAHTVNLHHETEIATLSYSDLDQRVMHLHTGKRDILMITKDEILTVPNGSQDILFYWSSVAEPFTPSFEPLPGNEPWYEFMFDSSIENVLNMSRESARAVLAVWVVYTLLRSTLTRPILAIFGQPASGKTAMMRMVYRLLYGRTRDLSHIGEEQDFTLATSENPLVVYDNVDTWKRWLPDALATSTGNTTTTRRKLWTDKDVVEYRKQAMVGLTAHSPKFIREDVADRLVVITLPRRKTFGDENALQAKIVRARNQLWGAIIKDIQRIFNTPLPLESEAPQFRMRDFALYGTWIARGLGANVERDFIAAIKSIKGSQTHLIVESEEILVNAIRRMVAKRAAAKGEVKYMTSSELFVRLAENAENQMMFEKVHKNSTTLGRRMWTMQEALKGQFKVEFQDDKRTGARLWLITDPDPEPEE